MSIYNRYDILTEFAKKKKSNVRTCLNGAKDATGASQTFDAAKVQINSEITKQKLENLKEKYKNTTNPYGFLTDLQIAMGLPRVKRASNYGIVTIPKSDGSATVSIRISNHSTNAETYITNNANQEYNLSIVVRKRARKKTFVPHDDVRLDEYIYYGNRLRNVESPLVQIINSIIGFLDSGIYVDTTGVALHNTSPQQPTNENKQYRNTNTTMKQKQTIKLNESQLRGLIKESIKNVLQETVLPDYYYDIDDNGEEFIGHGDDMFPDDILYIADKVNKLADGKLSVSVTNDGRITMYHNGSLSLESLELITKITKYLRCKRVRIDKSQISWMVSTDFSKSHKTQVGDKYFGIKDIPHEWQRRKPNVKA